MRRLRNMIQVMFITPRGNDLWENHVTYYLARIKYLLAENAYVNEFDQEEVKELIRDAAAFARLNKNTVLLEKIKVFEDRLGKENRYVYSSQKEDFLKKKNSKFLKH